MAYQPGSSGAAGDPLVTNGGHTLTWNLPASFDLPTGASKTFQFRVGTAQAHPGAVLINNALVSAAGDTHTQNNAASSEATTLTGALLYLPLVRY